MPKSVCEVIAVVVERLMVSMELVLSVAVEGFALEDVFVPRAMPIPAATKFPALV